MITFMTVLEMAQRQGIRAVPFSNSYVLFLSNDGSLLKGVECEPDGRYSLSKIAFTLCEVRAANKPSRPWYLHVLMAFNILCGIIGGYAVGMWIGRALGIAP